MASMLPDIKDALAAVPAETRTPSVATEPAVQSPAPVLRNEAVTSAPATQHSPTYEGFERKEARLTQDQLDSLEALRKKINRAKTVTGGERITDNTLIRVAVDMLLANSSKLHGSTEQELRKSVGLEPTNLQIS